ncbi:MAG: capsule biosynthesis protein CapC [Spirochaetaceae bacterium]|nr:capsule biosynthesis protein CapC [Spirochaetaceae bacterium]
MKFIDLHTHLLPGVDDSKLHLEQIEEMMNKYKEANFGVIAVTPHLYNPYVFTHIDIIEERLKYVKSIAENYGIKCILGSEVYVDQQEIIRGIPIDLRYQLIEFSTKLPIADLEKKVEALKNTGIEIIIAHVERYPYMGVRTKLFKNLRDMGVFFQVNVGGLENGSALPFVEERVADILSTDNHGDFTFPERYLKQLEDFPYLIQRMESLNIN